jgi:hypothetical protein
LTKEIKTTKTQTHHQSTRNTTHKEKTPQKNKRQNTNYKNTKNCNTIKISEKQQLSAATFMWVGFYVRMQK